MLKISCNRCRKDLGIITPAQAAAKVDSPRLTTAPIPGVSSIPIFCHSKKERILKQVIADFDLCENCSLEYAAAVIKWLPSLADVVEGLNQPDESKP